MKKFIFKGDMALKFASSVDLDVRTVREMIDALTTHYKDFRQFLVKKSLCGIEYFLIDSKGSVFDSNCSEILLNDDTYIITSKIEGGGAAMGILGNAGLGMIGQFAMGYGMNWLQDKLNPVKETGKEYEIIETNSYLYTSNENKVEQGIPVPVIYGQLRVGSLVINSQVNNYDYDYENARIYTFPVNSSDFSISMQNIQNGNYSFINPNQLNNLRNQADANPKDRILDFNRQDSSLRRSLTAKGTNAKGYDPKAGNASYNSDYGKSAGKGGTMERYGPSYGGNNTPKGGSTTVGGGEGPRPYLFPSAGQVDFNMRPSKSSTPVAVRKFRKNGVNVERKLSFDGTSSNSYLRVGDRGDYHKLESIAIYKSLDILSEGPIAGFANPIKGFGRDIGLTSYPVDAGDISIEAGGGSAIQIEKIKYDTSTLHFKGVESNSTTLIIKNDGDGAYTNISNGTFSVPGNDTLTRNLRIYSSKPTNSSSPNIGDTSFGGDRSVKTLNNIATTEEFKVSSNSLFLLRKEIKGESNESTPPENRGGAILINTNSSTTDYPLASKYTRSESIDGTSTTVYNLNTLNSDDDTLGIGFNTGGGLQPTDTEISISPYDGLFELTYNSQTNGAFADSIRANFLDAGVVLGTNTAQISQTLIDTLYDTSSANVPNSSDSWDKMCRIQIDSNDNKIFEKRGNSFRVQVGTYSYTYQGGTRGTISTSWSNQTATGTVWLNVQNIDYLGLRTFKAVFQRNDANSGNQWQTIKHNQTVTHTHSFSRIRSQSAVTISLTALTSINVPEADNVGQVTNVNRINDFRNGSSINMGTLLCFSNSNFSQDMYSAFINAVGGHHNPTTLTTNINGMSTTQKYLRYVPGTGSTRKQSEKVNSGSDYFNLHMLEGGNNNLDKLLSTYNGNTPYQRSSTEGPIQVMSDIGPYCPVVYPRITVYVVRKSQTFGGTNQISLMPTKIDALAITNSFGLVQEAYLYNSPNQPVWDTNIEEFTEICPQDLQHGGKVVHRPFFHKSITARQTAGLTNNSPDDAYLWQDIGFLLWCDKANDYQALKFNINQDGTVSSDFVSNSALRKELHGLNTSWADEIKARTSNISSRASGLIPDTTPWKNGKKFIYLDEDFTEINDPTTLPSPGRYAKAQVSIEYLDISKGRASSLRRLSPFPNGTKIYPGQPAQEWTLSNSAFPGYRSPGHVCTGRPLNDIKIVDAGSKYFGGNGQGTIGLSISKNLYNEQKTTSNAQIVGDQITTNAGYLPNSTFQLWVMNQSMCNNQFGLGNTYTAFQGFNNVFKKGTGLHPTALSAWVFALSVAAVEIGINESGHATSAYVINGGRGANTLEGKYAIAVSSFSQTTFYTAQGYGNIAVSNPGLQALDRFLTASNAWISALAVFNMVGYFPKFRLPKRDLILAYKGRHVNSQGQLNNFYVKQIGFGFNDSQVIENPFDIGGDSGRPSFLVTFKDGSLTSVKIETNKAIQGYSSLDTDVLVKFSSPPVSTSTGSTVTNDVENDSKAVFRAIYLNDVPIRDKNDRFNFSRFHFDIRVGNFKNGRPSGSFKHNVGNVAPGANKRLIDDEFLVPAHTTFINYPLFGPRNENQKDYYYSYTIKNPEVTDISFAIKINQLHYIYEGDEEIVYINLVPILGAILAFFLVKWLISLLARSLSPDPVIGFGFGCGCICIGVQVVGITTPGKPSTIPEMIMSALILALALAGGIIAAVLVFMVADKLGCKLAPFLCFKVGSLIKNSGEIWPAKIRFGIEYGAEGDTQFSQEHVEIAGCATSPFVKDVYINNLPAALDSSGNADTKKNRIFKIYRLTRELDPVTGGLVEARYKIDAELLSVTEYICGFFSYPNTAIVGTRINSKDMPDIPRREYVIKGRLLRVPNNYLPEAQSQSERYNGAWTGTFQSKLLYTSNPAWIIWDLLTNQRYGAGKYGITEEHLDKWSFYDFAKYCDEEVDVYIEGKATTERRHMCNLYIDSQRNSYEYVKELLQMYNASLNFTAGKFYFTADTPDKDPLVLFNNANVSEEGFSYSSTPETQRVTACTVDYVDERDNYFSKSEYVEDVEGIKKHGYLHVRLVGMGVTRKGEAHRLAWLKILTRQLEKEIVQFKTGIQAAYLRVGDVIDVVDNKKLSKHSGGRVVKKIGSNQLELDIPTSALQNVSKLKIQKPISSADFGDNPSNSDKTSERQTEQWETFTITNKNGFVVTVSGNLDSVDSGSAWIIEQNSTDKIKPKLYKVESIKELSHLNYEITAIDYVAEKYERINNSTARNSNADDVKEPYYGPTLSLFDSKSDVSESDLEDFSGSTQIKWSVSASHENYKLVYSVNSQYTDIPQDNNGNWIIHKNFQGQASTIAFLNKDYSVSEFKNISVNSNTSTLDLNNGVPWISLDSSNPWMESNSQKTAIINAIIQNGTHSITLS
jgi:predicted phage tail protein